MIIEAQIGYGALDLASQPAGVPLTVTQLNAATRQLIEHSLPLLWVVGEISNFTRAPSGHCYFSLKDARAQVRCVLFRGRAQHIDWAPTNGMEVEVRALPSLYEPRGEFQLTVDTMRRAGLGVLFEKFARLKAKLEQEGLFAPERKRGVPRHPRRIGIVTSPRAAALRDVLTTLRRRMPGIPVVIYPALVQGEGAAQQLTAAIRIAGRRGECDVLILCRGGGSIEDLWAFNDEALARTIAACPIPIVTGVGHETDFTIADFAGDARAPTPSGAAELVSPARAELSARLGVLERGLRRSLMHALDQRTQQIDFLARRLVHPARRIDEQRRNLTHLRNRLASALAGKLRDADFPLSRVAHRLAAATPDVQRLRREQRHLAERLMRAGSIRLERCADRLIGLQSHLGHLDPQQVLQRGYSIVSTANGDIVRSSSQVREGDRVRLEFALGEAGARITSAGCTAAPAAPAEPARGDCTRAP